MIGQMDSCIKEVSRNYYRYHDSHFTDPELIRTLEQGSNEFECNFFKSDVYSLGMVVLEMSLLPQLEALHQKTNSRFKPVSSSLLNELEQAYNKNLRNLIELMTAPQRQLRPNFQELEVIFHEMMSGGGKDLTSSANLSYTNNSNLTAQQIQNQITEINIEKALSLIREQSSECDSTLLSKPPVQQQQPLQQHHQTPLAQRISQLSIRDDFSASGSIDRSRKQPQQPQNAMRIEDDIVLDEEEKMVNTDFSLNDRDLLAKISHINVNSSAKLVPADRQSVPVHAQQQQSAGEEQQLSAQKQKKGAMDSDAPCSGPKVPARGGPQHPGCTQQVSLVQQGVQVINRPSEILDNMSCESYSVQIRDSKQYEQVFGIKKMPFSKSQNQELITSSKMSQRVAIQLLEDLNIEKNKSSYLLTHDQLMGKLSVLENFSVIQVSDISLHKENKLGGGTEGEVYGCAIKNNDYMTAKIIKGLDNTQVFDLLYQMNFFNGIQSKRLLKLEYYALCKIDEFNSDIYLLTKRKKLDLSQAIYSQMLSLSDKISVASQLVEILDEIQNNGKAIIVHGDLKPSNILLDSKLQCFLTDFGISQILKKTERMKQSSGFTLLYSPPEQVLDNQVEASSDIWSLGIVFYELFFDTQLDKQTADQYGLYNKAEQGALLVNKSLIKTPIKEQIAQLICKMTVFNPLARINPSELMAELGRIKLMLAGPNIAINKSSKNNSANQKSLEIVGVQYKKKKQNFKGSST